MKFYNQYDYKPLSRKEIDGNRQYLQPNGELVPSVTTILSKTKDTTFLKEWRARVGDKAANEIVREACNYGTAMHSYLENYINGDFEKNNKSNLVHQVAKKMAENIIENGLVLLEGVHGLEAGLYYEGLYAGSADLIGQYKGELCIVDFKNSKQIKKEEYIEDYYLQCVAYALAHNKMFDTNISKAIIMMSARPDPNSSKISYQNFVLEGDKFLEYCDKWAKRVEDYYLLKP